MNKWDSEKTYSPQTERKWQEFWESNGVYKFDEKDGKREVYSIDTPPPFTSGELHMGHVLSYCYFDFIARYKRMKGYNVYYPQGWDCQGFPTETKVEKKYGRKSPEEFRKLCVEWTGEFIAKMKGQMMALGFSPDWRYEYRTMSPEYWKKVQLSILKMYEKKEIYRASHPVFWCPHCQSALAKTDTEEVQKEGKLYYLKFGSDGGELEIATARPELLHACVAVLYHPADTRYTKLKGKNAITPLGKKVPILSDEEVDKEFGSGLVMVCTFGDKQDVVWMYRHSLPFIEAMDKYGKLINADEFTGLKCEEAKKKIVEKLEHEGKVQKKEKLMQNPKVHDRCSHRVELLTSWQWFARVKDKKGKIIDEAKKMKWNPAFTISYLEDWANFVEWDWVISRQRVFGTPLPFWHCEKCGEIVAAGEKELPVNPSSAPARKCPSCSSPLTPETSTCDCWVDSSITPLVISKWGEDEAFHKKTYPASLRPQGVEIIRTWAYYTIYRCGELTGKPPFKELLLNGNVLAPDGKKMSKSLGNVIAPDKLVEEYCADSVRQWAAMSGAKAVDRPFSYQDIKFAKSFITKFWNASKLVQKAIEGYVPNGKEGKELRTADKWILSRLQKLIEGMENDFENFEYHPAISKMHEFFWHEFCDYYLEYVKHRIYQPEVYGEKSKRAAQYCLYEVLLSCVKMLAPFTPHLSEEVYSLFRGKEESVHLSPWPVCDTKMIDDEAEKKGKLLNEIISQIRQHKAVNKMALNAELLKAEITIEEGEVNEIAEEINATGKVKGVIWKKGEFKVVF
ncbi:valine--tRNA ligase [Candidatus Micrarchaeota archaeon CG1_02_47_40]|nr:MAG: valine--tRNA ligase [Candidatus Micrarchaeota archaeon CG1_02_47_40]